MYQDVAGSAHGFATSDSSTFNDVDFPGATSTQAIDVNDAGDIVGDYFDAANVEHGFISSGGTFTAIDFPGATSTAVAGINANGDIVGGYTDTTGTNHGFLLSGGVFTPINFPLASSTTAFGINDNGDIAGFYTDTAGKIHGFVYADNTFSTVDVAGASATQLTRIKNWGTGDGRVHRRPQRGTRPHRSVSDFQSPTNDGIKMLKTLETKPPKNALSALQASAASKKVPSALQASAASKESAVSRADQYRIEEADTTETSWEGVPPAPKSGARPVAPAVLAAAVQSLALPQLPQPAPGQAINLGPIAGTESPTGAFGAGAVDLCEISPSGLVALGGDTFSGNSCGSGTWSPSMALQVQPGSVNGNSIQFSGSFGGNGTLYAEPPPNVPLGSQLPAGTVQVFGIDYAS